MESYPNQYLKAINCFNEGQYFECHEFLEELWLQGNGPRELFYQAILQAAVAIYHLERKNLFGAKSLFESSLKKFSEAPDFYMGLRVREFEEELKKFFIPIVEGDKEGFLKIDKALVPKIQLQEKY